MRLAVTGVSGLQSHWVIGRGLTPSGRMWELMSKQDFIEYIYYKWDCGGGKMILVGRL
jgi:hypothetical protein